MKIVTRTIETNKEIDNLVRQYGCNKMAKFLNVSNGFISEILRGTRNIKKDMYIKMCKEIKRQSAETIQLIEDNKIN